MEETASNEWRWKTRSGRELLPQEMSEEHLCNAVRLLTRLLPSYRRLTERPCVLNRAYGSCLKCDEDRRRLESAETALTHLKFEQNRRATPTKE